MKKKNQVSQVNNLILRVTRQIHQTSSMSDIDTIPSSDSDMESSVSNQYNICVDIMSNIMRYLDPTEIHYFLILPLSITWRHNFTSPQNLWKVFCLDEPFYVKLEDTGNESSDISLISFPICSTLEM